MLSVTKLKDAVQRGAAFLGAVGLLAGSVSSALPGLAFADALNPLTERSLTLSSSNPGWSYLDGSGNTTYAYPNSGANGQKTGNTFQFRVSSAATVKAMTFQYCTSPSGTCIAPGNNTVTSGGTDTLDLTSGSPTVQGTGTTFTTDIDPGSVIITAGGNVYTVLSVTDNDTLVLTSNATATETGVTFNFRDVDSATKSDLNVVFPSMDLISSGDWTDIAAGNDGTPKYTPEADGTQGEFVVLTRDAALAGTGTIALTNGSANVTGTGTAFTTQLAVGAVITINGDNYTVQSITNDTALVLTTNATDTVSGSFTYTIPGPADTYTAATDWAVTASNSENGTATSRTGKDNFITMTSTTGLALGTTDYVKVIFYGTDANYITNPGSGAFFVRMNTYSDTAMTTLIDGGVTVANVMNESISIRTKVLETMDFSVGTYDPATYNTSDDATYVANTGYNAHVPCRPLLMSDPESGNWPNDEHNVLNLGDSAADFSLATGSAHAVESYWRLSSNSSGGATVYYTGHTLTNTVGDEIAPLDDASGHNSQTGSEQFGLAIAYTSDTSTLPGSQEAYRVWNDNYNNGTAAGTFQDFVTTTGDDAEAHIPRLYPLVPAASYDGGAGTITTGGTAEFAFNETADTHAVPIATESSQVVNCVTAKMRYIANIAATTPAGVYTTKISYVAAPQY